VTQAKEVSPYLRIILPRLPIPSSPPSHGPISRSSRTPLASEPRRFGGRCTISARGPIPTPLAKYNEQKEALHAGRKPRENAEGVTVKELCNLFLAAKAASTRAS
jgi:hypothetical protein